MDNRGLFDGWGEALILVAVVLDFLCVIAAFPDGGEGALRALLEGVRCVLGACGSISG